MSANPAEAGTASMAPSNGLAGRLSVRDDGERFAIRIDVQAATVRYADGVLEVSLPKSVLQGSLKGDAPWKTTACDSTRT